MNKELATIQRVKNVRALENSDSLDVLNVLGWQIVTKRGEFKDNDLAVYVAIDTVLPEKPEFEFLRKNNFRIKPIRLRGVESAGIVFPLSILTPEFDQQFHEGLDVTDILGVKKYVKPIPPELDGEMLGAIPGYIIVADETNLRSYPSALEELYGRPYYITQKDDGTSSTFFLKGGEFGVCGRNIQYVKNETNGFWRMANKYDIESSLRKYFQNVDICIQGEIVGPGIQKNHLGLSEMEFHLFNIFDIKNRVYLGYDDVVKFCNESNIPMVKSVEEGAAFGHDLPELLKLSDSLKYGNGQSVEGIVVRPKDPFYSKVLGKMWSGKVLNTFFELGEKQYKQEKREKRKSLQNLSQTT